MPLSFPLRMMVTLALLLIAISSAYMVLHSTGERDRCLDAIRTAEKIARKSEMMVSTGVSTRKLQIYLPPDTELLIGGIKDSEYDVRDVISAICREDLRIVDSRTDFVKPVEIGPGHHTVLLINQNESIEVKLIE